MNDPCSIVIDMLPYVPFTERRTLPSCPGIYFALSDDGAILYIGKSQDLYGRWEQHNRLKQLAHHRCALIAWHACSVEELDTLESQLIQQFQPLLNGTSDPLASMAHIGVNVLYETWHAFRIACVTRKLSASKEIDRLMRQQLAAWQHDTKKETP